MNPTTIMLIPLSAAPKSNHNDTNSIAKNLANIISANIAPGTITLLPALALPHVESLLSADKNNELLEEIVADREEAIKKHHSLIPDISHALLFAGLPLTATTPYAAALNYDIAIALDAYVLFITESELVPSSKIMAHPYLHNCPHKILGYISFDDKPLIPQTLIAAINRSNQPSPVMTPPLFRHHLVATARRNLRRIVLPEGDEPRTLQAATICAERGLAHCLLLGEKSAIMRTAQELHINAIHPLITIIEPQTVIAKYVEPLYTARCHKGVTMDEARNLLRDNVMLGTMMMYLDEADGMVAGASHTTAHTVRAPFQIIKTAANAKIISSIFFVCLPEQVLVYGDCAINVAPTAIELADIAIQSALSSQCFGIEPRIAMLSYSTGVSGKGESVEKVKEATAIVKELRPDLLIEGPLQYDAAIDPEVAKLKLPGSAVAGHATIFIFPDLNSGNIGYKAVQRATGAVCIGPMLQGMRKPVNDLSRGCLVEDIVFTIVLTAVQAQ